VSSDFFFFFLLIKNHLGVSMPEVMLFIP